MKIFIDTSAYISLFIKKDINHQKVVEKLNQYKKQRALFLTSDYVLSELYTRLIYDFNKKALKDNIKNINKAIKNGELEVLKIDDFLFKKAEKIIQKFAEHKISFTDATICACQKYFKLDEIFTLYSDFKKIGFPTSF